MNAPFFEVRWRRFTPDDILEHNVMNKISTSIVSNARPVYIAMPVSGENDDDNLEILLEPIVAWKILYKADENSKVDFAEPIINNFLPDQYAIYDYETGIWSIPHDSSGKGLDALVQHLRER